MGIGSSEHRKTPAFTLTLLNVATGDSNISACITNLYTRMDPKWGFIKSPVGHKGRFTEVSKAV